MGEGERERARMGLGRSRKIYEGIEGKVRREKARREVKS